MPDFCCLPSFKYIFKPPLICSGLYCNMPGNYPNINFDDVLVGCPWRLENGWKTPTIPLFIPGKPGVHWCTIFGGGKLDCWLFGGPMMLMELQRLPSRLAAEMQRLEVTFLGGTLELRGSWGGEELGFLLLLKVPKSQANTRFFQPENHRYPLKIDGWKMKFPFEIVPWRRHINFRRGRYHLFGWGLLGSDLVMEKPLRMKSPEWLDVSQNAEVGWK